MEIKNSNTSIIISIVILIFLLYVRFYRYLRMILHIPDEIVFILAPIGILLAVIFAILDLITGIKGIMEKKGNQMTAIFKTALGIALVIMLIWTIFYALNTWQFHP